MKKPQPPCQSVYPWLKANLGPRCLAPLTGTDARALEAAVQIISLYSCCGLGFPISAFKSVVLCMQPSARELAYHAIAHVMEWEDRKVIWSMAEIEPLAHVRVCAFEPGGSQRS